MNKRKEIKKVVDSWTKRNNAGDEWYYGFMKRNIELSLRKPEKLSHSRAVMGNDTVIDHYYCELDKLLTENGLEDRAEFIFNCDETGVPVDFRPSKVIAHKKAKNMYATTSGDKTNITVMACANAVGSSLLPFVVFKGKRKNEALMQSAPSDGRLASVKMVG